MSVAQPVLGTRSHFAECPVWVEEASALFWVDCMRGALFRMDALARRSFELLVRPGALFAGLVKCGDGLLIVSSTGLIIVDLHGIERTTRTCGVDLGLANDAKVDRKGRLWFGTVAHSGLGGSGALHRAGRDLKVEQAADGLTVPNGPAFSLACDRLYLADSPNRIIYAYDCDAEGQLSGRRRFYAFDEADGVPDGMTIDGEDHLIVAVFGGGSLLRISPDGNLVARLELPLATVTSCTLGGPGTRTLFVTAALGVWPDDRRNFVVPDIPGANESCLYTFELALPGVPETPFRPD